MRHQLHIRLELIRSPAFFPGSSWFFAERHTKWSLQPQIYLHHLSTLYKTWTFFQRVPHPVLSDLTVALGVTHHCKSSAGPRLHLSHCAVERRMASRVQAALNSELSFVGSSTFSLADL